MNSQTDDDKTEDINDVFASIACSEDGLSRTAFEEGRLAGIRQGEIEGWHLGYHRGAEIGFEVGCVEGFARVYLSKGGEELKEKIVVLLKKLLDLCGKVPQTNEPDFDVDGTLNEIRSTYKKVLSLLKLPVVPPISPPVTQF